MVDRMISKDKTKCYIYTRVSTALQVDGYSLDAQRETMRKYADFQNMEISGNTVMKVIPVRISGDAKSLSVC